MYSLKTVKMCWTDAGADAEAMEKKILIFVSSSGHWCEWARILEMVH